MNKFIFILFIFIAGCKSTSEVSTYKSSVKDSISTSTEIKYVQESLKYTSEYDISDMKPFKQSFTNRGVTTTVEKDTATGKLKITNEVEADTLLTLRNSKDYFNNIEISDTKDETKIYTPNKFNWTIPLILGAIIALLILSKKFDLLKIGKNLITSLLQKFIK